MARAKGKYFGLNAANLLHSLRRRGGSAPLHTVKFSNHAIQYLIDSNLVKVQNTGCGFVLEINEEK